MAKITGGVVVTGFISPSDSGDNYAVIDPIYGIDGLRNFSGTVSVLDSIPTQRRRAGMFVGINNGVQMYQLKPSPWTNTISDWTLLNLTGGVGSVGGGGHPNYIAKWSSTSALTDSSITDDGSIVKIQLAQNTGTHVIDMPAVTNAPTGGVPDAVIITTRGHNGSSANQTGGIGVLMNNTKNLGFYVDGQQNITTNSIGFQVTFPSSSTTNTAILVKQENGKQVFSVSDNGSVNINTSANTFSLTCTNLTSDNAEFILGPNAVLNSASVYSEVNSNTVMNYCYQAHAMGTRGRAFMGWTDTSTDEMVWLMNQGTQPHLPIISVNHNHGIGIDVTTNADNDCYHCLHGTSATGNAFRYDKDMVGTLAWLDDSGQWNARKFITYGGDNTQVVLGDGTLGTYSSGGGSGIPYLEHNDAQKTVWDNGFNNISSNLTYGDSALFNATGTQNTAIGNSALFTLTTGSNNTAVGLSALASNNTRDSNTAIGTSALSSVIGASNTSVGAFTLAAITSGSDNVAIGNQAGHTQSGPPIANLTISNNGIFIGSNSKPKADNSLNEIVIGYNGVGNGNNTVTIGNGTITNNYFFGNLRATADVIAYSSSDIRLKENIKPIKNSLAKISKLGGYSFDWNDKQTTYTGHDIGVIAQEVEEVLPEVVITREDGYKAVKYEKIIALLIEGINELQEEVKQLKEKLNG